VILCVRRPARGVQLPSSSFYPAYLPRNIADKIDQGRLVPSFLSHLKIIMCTGIIFTVHKHSGYCIYRLTVSQEKNTFLLPIPALDVWLQWLWRYTSAPACDHPACAWNGLKGTPGSLCRTGMGLLPLDRVPSLGDNHRH